VEAQAGSEGGTAGHDGELHAVAADGGIADGGLWE